MADWQELLRQARDLQRLTQKQLAERAGVATDTVFSAESGRRTPRQSTLRQLCDALALNADARDEILVAAGYDPEPRRPLQQLFERRWAPAQMQAELEGYRWPCLVTNERMEIVAWNAAAVAVAELDFAVALPEPNQRHLLRITCMPHFRERVQNWDEVASVMVAMYKDEGTEIEHSEADLGYFTNLIDGLARDYPEAMQRLMQLWETVPLHSEQSEARLVQQIHWRPSDGADLRFNCVLSSWGDFDGLWAYDWQPADAVTWRWLEQHRPPIANDHAASVAPSPNSATGAANPREASVPAWASLLRRGRRATGLTQDEMAKRSGVRVNTLRAYETGRRRPSREQLLRMTRAINLDGATTNQVLAALSMEPEPSDWALVVAGQRPRAGMGRFDPLPGVQNALRQIRAIVGPHPWPCLVIDGTDAACAIAATSDATVRLFGAAVRPSARAQRPGLLQLLFAPSFRSHVPNWDEVAAALLPGTLGTLPPATARGAMAAIQTLLAEALGQDTTLLARLQELREAPPRPSRRVVFPFLWQRDAALLSFNAILSPWTPFRPYWALDLYPATAETWEALK